MEIFKNYNIMKRKRSNTPKMKRRVCALHSMDFSSDEYEAADGLVLLQTLFQKKKIVRNLKITFGGKRLCKRSGNNNVHSAPQMNVPNVVMGNEYNPPTIPGVSNHNILGCCKPFEKILSTSDLNVALNRLFLEKGHVEKYFLPLLKEGEDLEEGIDVVVYDMQGQTFNMKFKFWSGKFYVLNGGWKTFFLSHSFLANQDHITVWMFRHSETDNLCFALSVRRVQT
ncbi:ap2 b3-like transcriptional factor family protein [Trifolium pratense]|uniref:Ap2 b3-like transcriptional factor family protein n=1 Tax=Trifolium pratense TaxID=57577 RepID=A0A2K3M041_TRIPR|nr:ap2 b3-like transcriptional factor family protein [Trifolium pratense]